MIDWDYKDTAPGGRLYGASCEHGHLLRKCPICELEKEIDRLRSALRVGIDALESPETIAKLASIEHERWADWFRHQRDRSDNENLKRWNRQAQTPYEKLSEREKELDRREVRRYLPVIKAIVNQMREALGEEKP